MPVTTASQSSPTPRMIAVLIVILVVIAACIRWIEPNLYVVWYDEIKNNLSALDIAQNHQWTLVGPTSYFAALSHHSPLTTYIAAIPYVFRPDPVLGRLFTGLFGVIAVPLLFWMVKRYFGLVAGFIAGLMLAVHPLLVDWGRFVWNPSFGHPAIVLWFFTALLGYHEGKRWGQVAHWICLSLVVQASASLLTLIPVSFLLVGYRFWRAPDERRKLIVTHLVAWPITALTFAPWFIGLSMQTVEGNPTLREARWIVSIPTLRALWAKFSQLIGATDFPERISWAADTSGIWSETPIYQIGYLQSAVILLGVGWLVYRWLRRGQDHFPGAFLGLMTIYPLGLLVIRDEAQINLWHWYFMTIIFSGMSVLGIVMARLWVRSRYTRIITVGLVAVLFMGSTGLMFGYLDWLHRERYSSPLGTAGMVKDEIEGWLTYAPEVVILHEPELMLLLPDPVRFTHTEVTQLWEVFSYLYPLKFHTLTADTPLQPGDYVLVGRRESTLIKAYIAQGKPNGAYFNEGYHWVYVGD